MLELIGQLAGSIDEATTYGAARIIGVCIFSLLILCTIISYLLQELWKFIDDGESVSMNLFISTLLKFTPFTSIHKYKYGVYGYLCDKHNDNKDYHYFSCRKEDLGSYVGSIAREHLIGWDSRIFVIFAVFCTLSLIPLIVVLILDFLVLSIIVGGSVGIILLGRLIRRLQKKLDKHITDPEAHKGK